MEEKTENLTPIQRAILKQKELRESGMLVNRSPVEKFIDDPRIGRAVKMFCYECNGYSRSLANSCTSTDCPLWLFRKGKRIPDQSEIDVWRKKYAAHMKSIGEYGSPAEQADDDPYEGNDQDDADTDED